MSYLHITIHKKHNFHQSIPEYVDIFSPANSASSYTRFCFERLRLPAIFSVLNEPSKFSIFQHKFTNQNKSEERRRHFVF